LTPSTLHALNREKSSGIVTIPAVAQGSGGGGDNGALLASSIGPTKTPGSNPAELFRTAAMIAV
jgi:hypothetical protein